MIFINYYLYLFISLFMHLYLYFNEKFVAMQDVHLFMYVCMYVCMYACVYKFHSETQVPLLLFR